MITSSAAAEQSVALPAERGDGRRQACTDRYLGLPRQVIPSLLTRELREMFEPDTKHLEEWD